MEPKFLDGDICMVIEINLLSAVQNVAVRVQSDIHLVSDISWTEGGNRPLVVTVHEWILGHQGFAHAHHEQEIQQCNQIPSQFVSPFGPDRLPQQQFEPDGVRYPAVLTGDANQHCQRRDSNRQLRFDQGMC